MQVVHEFRWRAVLGIELLAYSLVASSFLWMYVGRFHEPVKVVPYHLGILAPLLFLPWCARALVWALAGSTRIAACLAAMLFVLPVTLLAAWYAAVLVGLDSWGRATTWPLIKTYVIQAPHLLGVLGVSPWIPIVVFVGFALAMVALVARYVAPHDWVRRLVSRGTRSGVTAIAFGLMLVATLLVHVQVQVGQGNPREPFAMSFLLDGSSGVQSHHFSGSPVLAERENEARRAYTPASTHSGRNLVIIVGDALRADHMSIYGYSRDTTPGLVKSVEDHDGEVVPNMRAACAESSCGLMALAASRPVSEIGSTPLTVQEVLRRSGYQVHFILGGDHTNFYGLRSMYGELDSFFDGSQQSRRYMNDDQLVLDRLDALPEAKTGQPVALQFHLMSTHGLGKRDPALTRFQPWANYYSWPGESPKRPPTREAAIAGVNYYDNGMLGFDHVVSRLLEGLERKGYLRDAVVVVTGDHGEMLGEHGYFSHQHGVSEQVLNIPFVLLRYGYSSPRFPAHPWGGQIDIAPTILHELGIPAPAIWKGTPLQQPAQPRDYTVQQGRNFGIYHIGADGRVLKYERDLAAGEETVIDPVGDPLGLHDLTAEVPPQLLTEWRVRSASSMLNAVQNEW